MISHNIEIHRMQRAFRQVMDAFAQPGTCRVIPLGQDVATVRPDEALDTLARMLVDQVVTFCCLGTQQKETDIAMETRSKAAGVADADFVIVPDASVESTVEYGVGRASGGTLISPEKGATVILGCGRVSAQPEEGLHAFSVEGPGVKERNWFYADSSVWARVRQERTSEYPCGIEIILVDPSGNVVAVPRSSKLAWEEGEC